MEPHSTPVPPSTDGTAEPIAQPGNISSIRADHVYKDILGLDSRKKKAPIIQVTNVIWRTFEFDMKLSYGENPPEKIKSAQEKLQDELRLLNPICERCEPWLAHWMLYQRHRSRREPKGGNLSEFVGGSAQETDAPRLDIPESSSTTTYNTPHLDSPKSSLKISASRDKMEALLCKTLEPGDMEPARFDWFPLISLAFITCPYFKDSIRPENKRTWLAYFRAVWTSTNANFEDSSHAYMAMSAVAQLLLHHGVTSEELLSLNPGNHSPSIETIVAMSTLFDRSKIANCRNQEDGGYNAGFGVELVETHLDEYFYSVYWRLHVMGIFKQVSLP
ncbi:hypothetical protein Q9L58_008796 [Maublancomyces gigas]|uniref:Uncharacterized protein n=1 Tax=Discina gigas TaxID=1032678 RepID=A0ABR3G8Q4_9PEZI